MFFNRSGQEQVRRYAIKKLSVGVASVCVGIGLAVCLPVAVFARICQRQARSRLLRQL